MNGIDCIGLALDLEARAKTVESQTTERVMIAAAQGLRLLASEQALAALTAEQKRLGMYGDEKHEPDRLDAERYRLLDAEDIIEPTDEFLQEDCTTWTVDTGGIFVGARYQPGSVLRVARRKVEIDAAKEAKP